MDMSASQKRKHLLVNRFRRRNKYNARRTNGCSSALEDAVFFMLTERELAGEITDIKKQQSVCLQEGGKDVRIAWKVDFSYVDVKTGKTCYCEAKGFKTADYLLKMRLWRKLRPASIEIWGGSYKRLLLMEKIIV